MSFSVLIVEDDPMVADINRRVVSKLPNFKVVGIAGTEAEAMRKISAKAPDLILLDLYLADGNGLAVLKSTRQAEYPTDVILITAAKDVQTVYTTLRYGAIDYIIKPFDLERLSNALNTYAAMRRILVKKEEVSQIDIDAINAKKHAGDWPAEEKRLFITPNLPKGVHQITLEHIVTVLLKEKKPLTCQEIAGLLSLSKITAWRYLEYLAGKQKIQYSLVYGATGRPSKQYFIS